LDTAKEKTPVAKEKSLLLAQQAFKILVGPAGVEPTTNGLKVRCIGYFGVLINVVESI
jgi:hypothetical protein